MKKIISMLLIFILISSSIMASFAVEYDQEEIDESHIIGKLLKGYRYTKGYVSTSKGEQDSYSKSVNYMIETGKILIGKNDTILKIPMDGTKDFDFYNNIINVNGKYFDALDNEAKSILKYYKDVDYKSPVESKSIIGNFSYESVCTNNVVTLMYDFSVYKQLGANAAIAWLSTAEDFAHRVKTGGVWDYKNTLGTYNSFEVGFGTYTGEQIGNMHYGTVGKFLFKENTLLIAAGVYQIISGTWDWSYFSSYFDDPADQDSIINGISLHAVYDLPTIDNYDN